ncbi:hypothetical protein L1887_39434 [Cichorium endivia]|nr:hypothetical protein L1887_39434 [Cichorium endivia]
MYLDPLKVDSMYLTLFQVGEQTPIGIAFVDAMEKKLQDYKDRMSTLTIFGYNKEQLTDQYLPASSYIEIEQTTKDDMCWIMYATRYEANNGSPPTKDDKNIIESRKGYPHIVYKLDPHNYMKDVTKREQLKPYITTMVDIYTGLGRSPSLMSLFHTRKLLVCPSMKQL